MSKGILEFRPKQVFFFKWFPEPNHFADEIGIKILSRTPVSILLDLSQRPQIHTYNYETGYLARVST